MSLDFRITSVERMAGLVQAGGHPVYQVKVLSHFTDNTYAFDDRFGSFLSSKTDDNGVRKEPLPHLAAAMREAALQADKRGDAPTAPETNPFMALAPTSVEPENPFFNLE